MADSPTSAQKGTSLEFAVHAIEATILRDSPAYSEKTFRIEMRKVVTVASVRHEIDIWVLVEIGAGYEAIFIFECKNWVDRVGKNEIIIFSEKIRALQAQRGFFVARSYTADAEAQAAHDPRITLLRVTELPAVEYVNEWSASERDRRVNSLPSNRAGEGLHELTFDAERSFDAGVVTLNGQAMARIRLRGRVQVRVVRAKIISYFDVATRGRALTVGLDLAGAQITAAFVERRVSGGAC